MPDPKDPCELCDCKDGRIVIGLRLVGEKIYDKWGSCPCDCHGTKEDRDTWEAESRADAEREREKGA